MSENYVYLELTKEDKDRLKSRWGAYKSDNVVSLRMVSVRKKMAEFLDFAFGEEKK